MNIALETSLISAATSFVVLLLGQILWPMIKDRRTKREEATYLAIRVVCVLDKFVEDCASTAIDSGEENDKGESIARVNAPDAPTYPTDVNWKSINSALMYKLLSLPAATERAANYVQGSTENSFPPDYSEFFEARTEGYGSLGLQAYELSKALRKTYKLPAVQFLAWDPITHMQAELKKISERHEWRQKEFEKLRTSGLPFQSTGTSSEPSSESGSTPQSPAT
jgi:hypothetical protein